ncbi:hypothetical protein OF83DRAFT_1114090 [Amylostereum chailletii]|nr:hypothetical protein OF83DRAFT_1114090 [Amylostereum chailletii]
MPTHNVSPSWLVRDLSIRSRCSPQTFNSVASAAIKLGALFRGQPDLIRGVNDFLPPGHKIPLDGTVLNSHVDQNAVTIANRR